jgi:NADPH:quinone reductase-like Zn-dependent oxidoreductase
MRLIRQQSLGGPDVLELVEAPRPDPAPTEVLVHVAAAGVNPVDWKTRERGGFLGEPPFTVGWDVAGVVEAVGFGVTRFEEGDRVFGMPRFPHEAAAYAEYATAPSRQLARIPEDLGDVEAGALPLAGLTAWQALVETSGVRAGQRVLILGAAGGVGHLAVQIAKSRGAYVVGTASAGKHAFLADVGADEAVDYTTVDVGESVRNVDLLLDTVGGGTAGEALPAVRDGGIVVTLSGTSVGPLRELAADRVRVLGILVEPDRAGLEGLAELVTRGELRPHVSTTFQLEDAPRAHELGETGRTQGKLVLTVD